MGEVNSGGMTQGRNQGKEDLIPNVKHVIAISSGKGGVGKTTGAVNLGVALRLSGSTGGLLGQDVYGPNIPMIMGFPKPPKPQVGKTKPARSPGTDVHS